MSHCLGSNYNGMIHITVRGRVERMDAGSSPTSINHCEDIGLMLFSKQCEINED